MKINILCLSSEVFLPLHDVKSLRQLRGVFPHRHTADGVDFVHFLFVCGCLGDACNHRFPLCRTSLETEVNIDASFLDVGHRRVHQVGAVGVPCVKGIDGNGRIRQGIGILHPYAVGIEVVADLIRIEILHSIVVDGGLIGIVGMEDGHALIGLSRSIDRVRIPSVGNIGNVRDEQSCRSDSHIIGIEAAVPPGIAVAVL